MSRLPSLFNLPNAPPPPSHSKPAIPSFTTQLNSSSQPIDPHPTNSIVDQQGTSRVNTSTEPIEHVSKRQKQDTKHSSNQHETSKHHHKQQQQEKTKDDPKVPFLSLIGNLAHELPPHVVSRLPRDMSAESMAEWISERKRNYPRLKRRAPPADPSQHDNTPGNSLPATNQPPPNALFAYEDDSDSSDGNDAPPLEVPIKSIKAPMQSHESNDGDSNHGDDNDQLVSQQPQSEGNHQPQVQKQLVHPCLAISEYIRQSTKSLVYNPFNSLCVILDAHAPPLHHHSHAPSQQQQNVTGQGDDESHTVEHNFDITQYSKAQLDSIFNKYTTDDIMTHCQYHLHNASLPPELELKQLEYASSLSRTHKHLRQFKTGTKSQQAFYRSKTHQRNSFLQRKRELQMIKRATPYADLYRKLLAADLTKYSHKILQILQFLITHHHHQRSSTSTSASTSTSSNTQGTQDKQDGADHMSDEIQDIDHQQQQPPPCHEQQSQHPQQPQQDKDTAI